jgi:hypothetical protein
MDKEVITMKTNIMKELETITPCVELLKAIADHFKVHEVMTRDEIMELYYAKVGK